MKYPCEQCEYQTTNIGKLTKHQKDAPTINVKYSCKHCDCQATQKLDLTRYHMRKKHICQEWRKQFIRKRGLIDVCFQKAIIDSILRNVLTSLGIILSGPTFPISIVSKF